MNLRHEILLRLSQLLSVTCGLFVCAFLCAWLAGCATGGGARSGESLALHLLHSPAAINLDDDPGPDGFALRVFATTARSSKGSVLPAGDLEILMFDGAIREGAPLPSKPRKLWTFSAADLRAHQSQSTLGTAYEFLLRWGADKPAGGRITLLARHRDRQNRLTHSTTSILAVAQP
ncbi:MAG: hypothetical protein FJ386_02275 [Verrucomicrobia bacterium]|nr:hypothetical protein [Verrucomicrobiota bacterium]